jgi:hypothetical protein
MLYTLFTIKNKPRWQQALYILFFVSLFAVPFLIFRSCEKNISPSLAHIALQINGKTYMYASGNYKEINKSVPMGFVPIYKDDEAYFVQPSYLNQIANTMGGNVELFEFKEASHDGYFSINNQDTLYHEQSEIVTTATIGEQIRKTTVTLRNKANSSMNISWSFSDKTSEFKAGKNCENHSFWIKTTVQPGETNISTQDYLVIPLSRLAKFYGCSVSYERETNVLFIKK